ncbi:hypothetical protein MMC28_011243 [Mycoblastus sanguinarius]|nr:hypothetical protein [Mycoblastus sanguinarius]
MAEHFLIQLPVVLEQDLPEDDDVCGICQCEYNAASPDLGTTNEHAVRLPCNHIIGSSCIALWLNQEIRNTCPYCRFEFYPPQPRSHLEELQWIADDSDDYSDDNYDYENEPPSLWDMLEPSDWDSVEVAILAAEIDVEFSRTGTLDRSRPFRDWLLYSQLRALGADLPLWYPLSSGGDPYLSDEQGEALLEELVSRGAFEVLPDGAEGVGGVRAIWEWLRVEGYTYIPRQEGGCWWLVSAASRREGRSTRDRGLEEGIQSW